MFFNLNLPYCEAVGRLDWKEKWGEGERNTDVTYHILIFSFTTALHDIHGLKEGSYQQEKKQTLIIFMFQRVAATFIKISQVTQSSPHLFTVMAGRLCAVYCKYVQAVNLQLALTENK